MNKFWTVLSHTYLSRFKTKSFIITTLLTIGIIFLIGNLPQIIESFTNDEQKIAVIDEQDSYFTILNEGMNQDSNDIKLEKYAKSEKKAKKAVEDGKYDALVVIGSDKSGYPTGKYYEDSAYESQVFDTITEQLQQIKTQMIVAEADISEKELAKIQEPVAFTSESIDQDAKTDEELNQARGILYVMLFVLYFAIIFYGNMIATEVATEKSSRVMEILVSSVSPVVHMFGKITGIALLGLTQIVAFAAAGVIVLMQKQSELTDGVFEFFGVQDVSFSLVIYAIVFFLLGYLLFATLAATLGSLVTRIEDVQLLMTPIIMLVVAAFMIAMFGLGNPATTFITVCSFIPFFAPMIMFLRVGMLDVPMYEVLISLGILVGTIALIGIIGARVYKGGVLMYGSSSSFKNLKKAFQLTKKE